jgi:undecaprenyl-diphosphatase
MDAALFTLLNTSHRPWLDDVMLLASALGRAGFIWLAIAGIAAVFPARRMAAWRLVLVLATSHLAGDVLIKPVVDRLRPYEVLAGARLIDQRPATASFPSGHATRAFAGALAASRLFPAGQVVWWPLAVAIGVSRIYVGAHWPSDVLAGALLGLAVAWFTLGGPRVVPRAFAAGAGRAPLGRRSPA